MNTIVTVTVLATGLNSVLHEDDLNIDGDYDVKINDDVPKEQWADVALDVFHDNIAIKVLDDFDLNVSYNGEELEKNEDHESYAFAGLGSLQ